MRKGTSLAELLIVLTIIVALINVAASIESGAMRELPRDAAIARTSVQMQNLLQTLRQDIQSAKLLDADANSLIVENTTGSILYERKNDVFTRHFASFDGKGPVDVRAWRLRDADIQWQTWTQGKRKYALEVRTAFVTQEQNRPRRKLANSQVFFLAPEGAR
jgi:hypothetical protein